MTLQSSSDPSALLTTALEKLLYLESRLDSSEAARDEAAREMERHRHSALTARQALADWQRRATDAEVATEGAEREVQMLRSALVQARHALNAAPRETELATALKAAEERLGRFEREREIWLDRMVVLQRLGSGGDELDLGAFISELRSELLSLRRGEKDRPRITVSDRPAAPDPGALLADIPGGALDVEELIRNARLPRSERTLASLCVRDLRSDSAAIRRRAAERLTESRVTALVPLVASLLGQEAEVHVRMAYVRLIDQADGETATLALQRALSDVDARVRATAFEALAARPGVDVSAVLQDVAPPVRRRALALLPRGRESVEALARALRDDDASVRHVAALSLAACSGAEARAVLAVAARSKDAEVREVARRALARRGLDWSVAEEPAAEELPPEPVPEDPAPDPEPPPVVLSAPVEPVVAVETPVPDPVVEPPQAAPTPQAALTPEVVAEPTSAGLDERVLHEIRTSLRGRTVEDLAAALAEDVDAVTGSADRLVASGTLVWRGRKLFQS